MCQETLVKKVLPQRKLEISFQDLWNTDLDYLWLEFGLTEDDEDEKDEQDLIADEDWMIF